MSGPLDAEKLDRAYLQTQGTEHHALITVLVAALNPILEEIQERLDGDMRYAQECKRIGIYRPSSVPSLLGRVAKVEDRLSALEPKPTPDPLKVGDRVVLRGEVVAAGTYGFYLVPDGSPGDYQNYVKTGTRWERE